MTVLSDGISDEDERPIYSFSLGPSCVATMRKMNLCRLPVRRMKALGKNYIPNNEISREKTISFSGLQGDSVFTSVEAKTGNKAASCIGSSQFERIKNHTSAPGHENHPWFTSSGSFSSSEEFGNGAADAVCSDLLDKQCYDGPSGSVFCASTASRTPRSECCKVTDFSAEEQHAVIPGNTVAAQWQLGELVESMVMANGDETQSGGQTSDRSCTDVERILRNDLYRKPFQQFLEQQFCAENINFYMAVEEYRSIPDTDLERRTKVARQIFERHFSPNSVEPVNIDNSTSKSIRDAVMSQNFTAQLYDVAQYQIFHLLKYDCWPRYLRAGGVAPTFDDGSEASGIPTINAPTPRQRREDKKRKSLIWHGLRPRFSLRKKAWSDGDGSLAQSCESSSSPVHKGVEQSLPLLSRSQPVSRLLPAQEHLGYPENTRVPWFVKSDTELKFGTLSKYGLLRRRGFSLSGRQRSVPTETTRAHSGAPSQSTSSFAVSEVCTKFCTLMLNDAPCVEQIALRDPSESVGKWTAAIAAKRGMDPRATEVVDAQSGATIDPARQAVDALNNRCVRLLPVLHFAAEIMIPSPSNKTGTCAHTRFLLLRARHGLSLNAVLRPVLAKYLIDYDSCVIVLPSSFDAVSGQTTVGSIGQRCVLVMTQQQYQERRYSPKRETAKDLYAVHFSTPEKNLPFYQHGDVAFVELPPDFDLRTGKVNATRSYSNAKTEHTSGILKFVRKASQAVTLREPSDGAGPSSSLHQHHQPQPQHSGGHNHSQSMTRDYADKTRRKSLGTFQRTASVAMADIPYCGEDTAVENLRLPETTRSAGSAQGTREHVDGREKMFEIPEFLRKENAPDLGDTGKLTLLESNAPKIPSLYTSTVSSEKDFSSGERRESLGWQRADYV